ncbi:dual oxidase maturation factor 1-like isoform X3 [Schistocerca americana]|uniref:dual oxidase maturation factor 1-like isoform X3 n=1 Tax=Schistocerca americana TaxID=7009 RepID=UPI001F4F3652|nr:dual oxidase maturation factor 1-like isoform X3 [Schistocerca americana]XP_047121402.1 dual oxidase maturation factor 1-like isoform X2 [Schistocerca piceifrons]XP_049937461.1 dual oxidase maturation factor 1-like isoform X2 [Schistocerca serialis cubense]
MSWFNFHRIHGFPTQYEESKTAVTADVLEAGLILSFVILAVSFYLVIPGYKGKERLWICLRTTLSLFVGVTLMLGNFGQEWETGDVSAKTPYKAGTPKEINAIIGVKLGLRSVNVTLKQEGGQNTSDDKALKDEIINYNERFTWEWDQGIFGFGPRAGQLQREFRHGQLIGLPIPILWIIDYLVIDGEGFRFGRYYRTAGWYAHIAMWSAFPCWLVANLSFLHVVRYGGYFMVLTGFFQILACILWASIRNYQELAIPIGKEVLVTHFGFHFWLVLIVGVLVVILGLLITYLDLHYPDDLAVFFGLDPLSEYEEYHLTAEEFGKVGQQISTQSQQDIIEMGNMPGEPSELKTKVVFKRRGTVTKAQKTLFRTPLEPSTLADDDPSVGHSRWGRGDRYQTCRKRASEVL